MHIPPLQTFSFYYRTKHAEHSAESGRIGPTSCCAEDSGEEKTNTSEQHHRKEELGPSAAVSRILRLWPRFGRTNDAPEPGRVVGLFLSKRGDLGCGHVRYGCHSQKDRKYEGQQVGPKPGWPHAGRALHFHDRSGETPARLEAGFSRRAGHLAREGAHRSRMN
jgi:hypothetical protein